MKRITLKDVNFKVKDKEILKNINLTVNQGESVAILGPNGAGKTTLINCILKLQKIDSGEIINDFESLPKYKIGVHSQEQSFYKLLKVKEILDLFLFEGEYMHLVEKYGLENNLNQQIGELSTGEFKKLSLIILLENDPEIIFIDEITTGLDTITRMEVLSFLKNELKKSGKTMIMVTHYLEEVEEISEKLVFLKKGEIVESGLKNDLCTKYGLNYSENNLIVLYNQVYKEDMK
ncbi:MAG: ABC transporter ATP-binding protein [Methanobrevibacter sp.]|jgi:ABC-2 type transport system ATP-binding protein|nr:ABC transporter ATP-binding protein [Candidatus Methanovirga australis]